MIELPTLANGRYAVKRYLGQGGMAAVFLVYDNTFEDRRAIKVLNPSLVTRPAIQARFRTEAQAMARLNHPNIVRVYDHGMEGITSYIVMDYLPHGSLQDHLEANGHAGTVPANRHGQRAQAQEIGNHRIPQREHVALLVLALRFEIG